MLVISKEQVDKFVSTSEIASARSMALYFFDTMPDYSRKYDSEVLVEILIRGIKKARFYGVARGVALVQFLSLLLMFGEHFDEDAAIKQFLSMPGIEAETKLDLLTSLTCDRLREIANGHGA